MPKVSIIVPIYNVEKYLSRCMDSLLNQTLKDIEIILVDDGSPDNCPSLCDDYVQQDERIKVIHKKNGGLGLARNSGIKIATGEFVAFLDSDDYVKITMYEELYNNAKHNNLDAVYCNFNRVLASGKILPITEVKTKSILNDKKQLSGFLFGMIGSPPSFPKDRIKSVSACFGIYSREKLCNNKIFFPSEKELISEDLIFNIEFLKQSDKIGLSPSYNYFYCENEASLSKSYRKDRFERYKILHKEMSILLAKQYPKDMWINSIDRCIIGYTRSSIMNEISNTILDKDIKIRTIDQIVKDDYFRIILKRYPYKKLPIKHFIFFLLLKYKKIGIIYRMQQVR
jgi:glycosyltransferase involved in cell wall biosynthesis